MTLMPWLEGRGAGFTQNGKGEMRAEHFSFYPLLYGGGATEWSESVASPCVMKDDRFLRNQSVLEDHEILELDLAWRSILPRLPICNQHVHQVCVSRKLAV